MAFQFNSKVNVYVRKEYLYDLQKGHGEVTPGVWISVKSTMYKALYFETLLTDYGALYDSPIHISFPWKTEHGDLLPLMFCSFGIVLITTLQSYKNPPCQDVNFLEKIKGCICEYEFFHRQCT